MLNNNTITFVCIAGLSACADLIKLIHRNNRLKYLTNLICNNLQSFITCKISHKLLVPL